MKWTSERTNERTDGRERGKENNQTENRMYFVNENGSHILALQYPLWSIGVHDSHIDKRWTCFYLYVFGWFFVASQSHDSVCFWREKNSTEINTMKQDRSEWNEHREMNTKKKPMMTTKNKWKLFCWVRFFFI